MSKRKRYKKEEKEKIIEGYRAINMSLKKFCKEKDVNESTLFKWLKKEEKSKDSNWVEVRESDFGPEINGSINKSIKNPTTTIIARNKNMEIEIADINDEKNLKLILELLLSK